MKPIYVDPGSYCPPTYGHQHKIFATADTFPKEEIIMLCSENPNKTEKMFSPDECKILATTYNLPKNIRIKTLVEFIKEKNNLSRVVIIRGIRDEKDYDDEKKVVWLNYEKFGIKKYLYIISDEKYRHISSTKARLLAENLEIEKLSEYVSPLVVSTLLEKTLNINNLFMVVGRPGSGKSTFLKMLVKKDERNFYINSDEINHELKPFLEEKFGTKDLKKVLLERKEEFNQAVASPWLKKLADRLREAPKNSNVFIEVPYGLKADEKVYRFIGGKIIYIGCQEKQNEKRVVARGTDRLLPLIKLIPNKKESIKIAKENKLWIRCVDTSKTLIELEKEVESLNQEVQTGGMKIWQNFLS